MKIRNQAFILAAPLAVLSTMLIADDNPVSDLVTPDSRISVGVGTVSGDREQFGIFDDIRGSETMLLLDADVNKRDDDTGTWTTLKARNLGTDNRVLELGYERQGDWGVSLDYNQIQRMAPYTVNSGITGLGTETQTVPASGSAYVAGTGANIQLGTERERIGLDFFKYLNPELNVKVGFKNEEKNGNRHWGRGGAAEFAAEPIDATTRTLDATVNYAGKHMQLSGGYIGNWYTNHNDLVTTSNGANTYYLSLPMDNQAHQLFLNGGYSFTPGTRGTFRISYTHATQDEHLPTADIAGLAYAGAPTSLNGELNTTLVFLGLTARPMKNLSVTANLRYHKVDEQTPEWLVINTGNGTHSTPLDYATLSGKLEGTYRLPKGYSLIAGIDIKNQDRTVPHGNNLGAGGLDTERYVPFRADLDETTYRLQVRKSMSETINGALALLHSERDGSSYSAAVHSEPGEGTGPGSIDPINIADRRRDKLRASLDWAPTERANLTFNVETARDDYSGHTLGLRDGTAMLLSVDGSYKLGKDWQLTGWISHDTAKAKQHNFRAASGGYSEAELYDTLKDVGDSVGFGLDGIVNPKLKVGANFEWTHTRSEYDQSLVETPATGTTYYAGTTGPLPDIKSTATKLNLFAEYALEKKADLRFDLVHERWRTNDWTWQFSDGSPFIYDGTSGAATSDRTTVITDPNQAATFVGVRYIYKF